MSHVSWVASKLFLELNFVSGFDECLLTGIVYVFDTFSKLYPSDEIPGTRSMSLL
jgi:hypothetical protein